MHKYYIIAGEASGDLHGAGLMRGLLRSEPDCLIRFHGGEKMAAVGGIQAGDYRKDAVMGIVEVVNHIGSIAGKLKFCKKDILDFAPDAVIFIDYPGFNLKLAKFAHRKGLKTIYYIPPKLWARGESRSRLIKKYIDRCFIIFPFEVPYFRSLGISATYHGNPLVDKLRSDISSLPSRQDFLRRYGIEDDGREIIALLPGSRKMEVDFLLPRLINSVNKLKERGSRYRYIVAAAPSLDRAYYEKFLSGSDIDIIPGESTAILHFARAAVISSGTASLEAAIIGTPQLVCYGMNPLTYFIARIIVKLDTISLANMILGRRIFQEYLQGECSPERIAAEVERLCAEGPYRQKMLAAYHDLNEMLGKEGSADRIAADIKAFMDGRTTSGSDSCEATGYDGGKIGVGSSFELFDEK